MWYDCINKLKPRFQFKKWIVRRKKNGNQNHENEINELTTQLSFIQTEHTKRTHETQSKMAYTFQNLKNSTIENDQLRYMLNEQQKNNDTQYDEIAKLKNTIHSLENTNITLKKENETIKSINKQLKESVKT